jgi:formamidopyrimidine-DNA glycosylase
LDSGKTVVYRDVRRFGTWLLLSRDEVEPYLAERLGHEPLGPALTSRELGKRLAGRRAPIKSALLDQRVLAGVGNIYADEALWYARIHPLSPAGRLDRENLKALRQGVRRALELGIARQGSTLTDYRQPDGSPGRMQDGFRVYGRGGEPCFRCGAPIEKRRVAGRGTWFCPGCQVLELRASAAAEPRRSAQPDA